MIMLETAEDPFYHRVLEEVWPYELCDLAFVSDKNAELPGLPPDTLKWPYRAGSYSANRTEAVHCLKL
jgi:hypothetical protein